MLQNNLNNNVSIVGVIASPFTFSHEVYGEGFYNFYVNVSRLSDFFDRLPVTISERLFNIEKLSQGTSVHIEGQIRSYNSYETSNKRNRLILTVFTKEFSVLNEMLSSDTVSEQKPPNEVMLNGYICKAPIFRTTPFGREISDILLAVNRSYNKSDYIPCIAWGRNARYLSNMSIGDNIKIFGRMQSRVYQKKIEVGETIEKTAYEVSISKIEN
ncbi:MAG: single-stranded DNA-binding protein [Defluviitaleaceae bacterium]|nr:single-stranded DNA-binding protein [Defluviitaleaceae bacterium]